MIAPVVFASFLLVILMAPMLRLLGISWLLSFIVAGLLSALVGYFALSATGAL